FGREAQMAPAPVGPGPLAAEQPPPLEAAKDPAEVAGIHPERRAHLAGGGSLLVSELVEHSPLGEGERALEESFVEDTDLSGVEPVEAAHGGSAGVEGGRADSGHANLEKGILCQCQAISCLC